jgi:hypothetical protein
MTIRSRQVDQIGNQIARKNPAEINARDRIKNSDNRRNGWQSDVSNPPDLSVNRGVDIVAKPHEICLSGA